MQCCLQQLLVQCRVLHVYSSRSVHIQILYVLDQSPRTASPDFRKVTRGLHVLKGVYNIHTYIQYHLNKYQGNLFLILEETSSVHYVSILVLSSTTTTTVLMQHYCSMLLQHQHYLVSQHQLDLLRTVPGPAPIYSTRRLRDNPDIN